MYVPRLAYPLICRCALGLRTPFGDGKQCYYTHGCTKICVNLRSLLLGVYPEVEFLDHMTFYI